jgi:DNA adenine methylase
METKMPVKKKKAKKLTLPLKWHGGKNYLAPGIIKLKPPHQHYDEPYFGGGAVLLARDPNRDWYEGADEWTGAAAQRGCSEVVNDLNGELTNFWRVLQRDVTFQKFLRAVQAMPFSEQEWRDACESQDGKTGLTRAIKFFVRCRQSLAGRMKSFAPLSRSRTRGNINEQANAWLGAVEGLAAVHERLKSVVILNDDALKVIRKEDSPKTLHYLDPPYFHATRTSPKVYEFEMTDEDHRQMLETIQNVKGKVMLSGYHSALYDDMLQNWNLKEFVKPNNSAGGKEKRKMTECIWMNY